MEVLIPLFLRSLALRRLRARSSAFTIRRSGARNPAFRRSRVWIPAFRRSTLLLGIAISLAAQALVPSGALAQSRRPEDVKAAFLYNFTRFVDWPDSAFAKPDSPLIIGVADDEATAAA